MYAVTRRHRLDVPDELPKQLIAILMGLAIFIVLGFFLRDLTRAQKVRWL